MAIRIAPRGSQSMFRESVKRIAIGLYCILGFPVTKPSTKFVVVPTSYIPKTFPIVLLFLSTVANFGKTPAMQLRFLYIEKHT